MNTDPAGVDGTGTGATDTEVAVAVAEAGRGAGTIGVFDSGMGGLTVLRALTAARVAREILYLGDTARLPYGTKSPATVRRYAVRLGQFLVERGVEFLVVACNTVSAVALDVVERELGVPVLGVVEPGARAAVDAGAPIGVLGTEATIKSGAYVKAIAALAPGTEVRSRACPLFVPLVEEGWTDGEVAEQVAARYLADVGDVRTLLLGCTHYPMLAEVLHKVAPQATIIDSAVAVADAAGAVLGTAAVTGTTVRYFVTDGEERFVALGRRIMGEALEGVELVDV